MKNFAASQRKACELAHIARSSFRYQANPEKDEDLRVKLTQLAQEKPRCGYRGLAILLGREGQVVNHKRPFRIYRAAGLSRRCKKRRRLCVPVNRCSRQQHQIKTGLSTSFMTAWQTDERCGC